MTSDCLPHQECHSALGEAMAFAACHDQANAHAACKQAGEPVATERCDCP